MIYALIALTVAIGVAWLFNRLIRRRNQVRNAWSDVDVQLQRRHDLVPMLVASVKGYAQHERELLQAVTQARQDALNASTPTARSSPEKALSQQLGRLLALGEAYPDLKASGNFSQLSDELVVVEDALQHARRFYNGSVRDYNTAIERFPALVIARSLAFKPAEFFAAESAAQTAPTINLT